MATSMMHRSNYWAPAVLLSVGLAVAGSGTARAANRPGTATAATATATASAGVDALLDQLHSGSPGDHFLPPDQAFRLSATATPAADGSARIKLTWLIAPGYYLYRDRIKAAGASAAIGLGKLQFPPGIVEHDQFFGAQVIYHNQLIATLPVTRYAAGASDLPVRITYQGCAEAGLCYPPITRALTVALTAPPASAAAPPGGGATSGNAAGSNAAASSAVAGTTTRAGGGYVSEQDRLAGLIRSGNILGVLATFFGLGLLLAFTPCCLPMVPILSGLIAGAGTRVDTGRAFALSLTYVLGMAVTYTVTGAVFAAAGQQVQAAFQQPWIIVLFAALFAAMALSMFGFFTVQMPGFIQTRVAAASNRQRGGHFGGVAVMGALSSLIVTTCVAPPLVATLAVIGQSGAIARGAAALFVMSLGMGAPLLVVGSTAGRWLPKAGPWMTTVKRLFGVLMLALAAWMLTRLVPAAATLWLFVVPALAAAVVLLALARTPSARRTVRGIASFTALAATLYGVVLIVGAARGSDNPLAPLSRSAPEQQLAFENISSVAQLDQAVHLAALHGQPVMLDFYADWCTSCKEMQRYTFTDPSVRSVLHRVRLLRADVTANTADDQALLHRFHIYGPPTIAFYDGSGHEQRRFRVVGYMKPAPFAALLHQALTPG